MCADAARLPLRPPRHGTFLSISPTASSGPTLRGDSTSIGFSESFHAKVQRSFRTKARRLASDAEEKGGRRTRDEDIDEEKLTKDRVSWFGNKHIKSTESKVEVRLAPSGRRRVVPALILAAPPPSLHSQLRKAQKEGRLSEALLDRRTKLKRSVALPRPLLAPRFRQRSADLSRRPLPTATSSADRRP